MIKKIHFLNRQRSKKTIAIGIIAIVLLALLFPNLKGSLKLFGFIERDFIPSQTGFKYETNKETAFKAYIADAIDDKKATVKLKLEQNEFQLTLLEQPEATSSPVIPIPSESEGEGSSEASSPSSIPTINSQLSIINSPTPESTPSSSSGNQTPKSYEEADLYLKELAKNLKNIASESSSISAQVDILSQDVSEIVEGIEKIEGPINQGFFGPFETIKQKGIFSPKNELTYYIKNHSLIETWKIDKLSSNILEFLFESENSTVKIIPSQDWEIISDNKTIMTIKTTLFDKNNQAISLPIVKEKNINIRLSKTSIPLELPEEILSQQKTFPVTIIREFIPLNPQNQTPNSILASLIGETLEKDAVYVSQEPKYLAKFNEDIIVGDEIDKTVSLVTFENKNVLPLFLVKEISGLSCNAKNCFFAGNDDLYRFNPTEIATKSAEMESENFIKKLNIENGPPDGVTVNNDNIYYTSNVAPNGSFYEKNLVTGETKKLLENLSFPQSPTINIDGSLYALWADGQLYIGSKDSDVVKISLPQKPESISIGSDNLIYFILNFPKTNTKTVTRLNSKLELEVLRGISGNIQSIFPAEKYLVVGFNISSGTGAIVKIQSEDLSFIPAKEYE